MFNHMSIVQSTTIGTHPHTATRLISIGHQLIVLSLQSPLVLSPHTSSVGALQRLLLPTLTSLALKALRYIHLVAFSINKYLNEVCHILLGWPWHFIWKQSMLGRRTPTQLPRNQEGSLIAMKEKVTTKPQSPTCLASEEVIEEDHKVDYAFGLLPKV